MRLALATLLFGSLASAGVTCKQADQTTNNGAGGSFTVDSAGRGTCGAGFSRPVYYVVTAASYGTAPFNTAAFDKDMQAVFNDANLGDFVLYKAGDEFIHGPAGGPRITRRPGDPTKKLTVTTTEYAKLPSPGTRITPAYLPLLPRLLQRGTNNSDHSYAFFSLVGIRGLGDHGSGDHVTFRGLNFRYASTNDTYVGYFELNGGNIRIGSGGRGIGMAYATTITSTPLANGVNATIPVLDTHAFAVTTPRQRIVFSSSASTGYVYTVEGVNDGAHTITVDRPLVETASTFKVYPILNQDGESQYQPDDILIQQCVFDNPIPRVNAQHFIVPNSRALTVRDNWFQLVDYQGGQEPKMFPALDAYGPHLWENNFFWGAETAMYGGGPSATNASTAAGGMWRYNMFSLPNEFNNISTWDFLFNNPPPGFNADMSVAGLPANSARFVIAGHGLDAPSSLPAYHYWTALNSGVVGTTRPACFVTGTVSATVRGSRCYDGDRTRPGKTLCADGVGPDLKDGDGVCWQLNQSGVASVKNAWESKSSSHITLQHNVFSGFPSINAYNTVQFAVINFKIASYYVGNNIDHPEMDPSNTALRHSPGCRWYTADPLIPTTAKIETLYDDYSGTVNDPEMAALYASTGGYNQWPECSRAFGDHFAIKNNWFRNVWGGLQVFGYYSSWKHRGTTSGDWEVSGNLLQMRSFGANPPAGTIYQQVYKHTCISIGANASDEHDNEPTKIPVPNVNISNNTCYTPFSTPAGGLYAPITIPGEWSTAYEGLPVGSQWNVFSGQRKMSGNVIGRWGDGIFLANTSLSDSRKYGEGENVANYWPGTQRNVGGIYGIWGRQVMLGSAAKATDSPGMAYTLGAYPKLADGLYSVWTGCGDGYTNVAPCYGGAAGATAPPDYSKVLVNPAGGDFRVKNDHPFAKRSQDGNDLGADPNQLPMIQGLTVTPTDRSVLFTYRLTPVIQDIPCVVELHTSPDLESTSYAGNATGYKAELTQLLPATSQSVIKDAAGNNIDSDAFDRNYRDGNRRMIAMGITTNLAANMAYYYRLHCGGDAQVGMVMTLPTLSGTATQTITRAATETEAHHMTVEYGTSYSRTSDTISGGGTSSPATCAKGARCTATFSATRGTMVYYRWKELDSGNSVLRTGKVEVMPVL